MIIFRKEQGRIGRPWSGGPACPRGLTLSEVLVVSAVVGVLAAVAIPAIQRGREAGRRSACMNNLRQIGQALSGSESVHGAFPKLLGGGETSQAGGRSRVFDASIHVRLLPYLEQAALYNALNFRSSRAFSSSGGDAVLPFYLCPADSTSGRAAGSTSYAANATRKVSPGRASHGSFDANERVRLSSFQDGTSQTVAFAEWALGPPGMADLVGNTYRLSDGVRPDPDGRYATACDSVDPWRTRTGFGKGTSWSQGSWGVTMYDHTLPINHHSCLINSDMSESVWTAGSRHPGGAQVVFADGHCAFLGGTISQAVWRALGTRDGQEIMDSVDY